MSKIVRYCKLEEEHVGDNAFDVSRGGILGNPYTHIKDRATKALIKVKTRDLAIDMYKHYFKLMMESEDPRSMPFKREFRKIVDAYKNCDVVYVGCYCHLNESCHADFIIDQVIKTATKESIQELREKRKKSTEPL